MGSPDDAHDRDTGDLQHRQTDRRRGETAVAPARVAEPRHEPIERDQDDHDDPPRRRREQTVREVIQDVVVDRERAAVAQDQEHDPLEREQAGERDDERRQPEARDDRPLEQADQRGGVENPDPVHAAAGSP